MGVLYPMRITTERQVTELQRLVAHLEKELDDCMAWRQQRVSSDLDDINAMLEEEIEYRRDLEEMNEMLNDQWFDLIMENQHLRTALEQAQQEGEQITDKLNFATMMYGAVILSDEYENREDD